MATEDDGGVRIERALLSAYRKEGLVAFGRFLADQGAEILSTGGSARTLREGGVTVKDVSEVTGYPEMMDGRVKTLHPRIHGGLLYRRDVESHAEAAREHGIPRIDLVYVDLYPFEETLARQGVTEAEVVEMIDIGGPSMIRSAAKNHASVLVLTDPGDLERAMEEIRTHDAGTSLSFRRESAARAFRRTAAYDAAIASWMTEEPFPERLVVSLELKEVARYGENPHQEAAVYLTADTGEPTIGRARQLNGKGLSYNNYLDATAAFEVVRGLGYPAAAVVKHRNPCGAAMDPKDAAEAFKRAYAGDPMSAFGGIVALNRAVSVEVAREIADPAKFLEVVVAPSFDEDALPILIEGVKWGRNLRLLAVGEPAGTQALKPAPELRAVSGAILVQEPDRAFDAEFQCVTRREPSREEVADLRFAWEICRHAISNAIVIAREGMLVGLGAGQTSRVDAVEQAARKAGERAVGAALASDAFFPFPDGVEAAHAAGVTAVIQPGGSRRDADVIAACDRLGLAMVFTGRRHFRH